jgi:hypothetical protein
MAYVGYEKLRQQFGLTAVLPVFRREKLVAPIE